LQTFSKFDTFHHVKAAPNRLRVVRAEKRKNQLDVARRVGISQTQLSLIENRYVDPSPELRAKLARALGVDEIALFPESVASA